MTSLEAVDLSNNNLSVPHCLNALIKRSLSALNLGGNHLGGKLADIFLNGSNLSTTESTILFPSGLKALPKLKTYRITSSQAKFLIRLTSLSTVRVAHNKHDSAEHTVSGFEDNTRLCGAPLDVECGGVVGHDDPPPLEDEEEEEVLNWIAAANRICFSRCSASTIIDAEHSTTSP
ncbi:hypothetical protein DY000_02004774, partial [Brassica cretica]